MLNVSKIDNLSKLAKQNDQEIDFGGVGGGRKRGGGVGGEAEGGGGGRGRRRGVKEGRNGRKQILPLYSSSL